MKILIVEDDPNIADVLGRGLRMYDFEIDTATDGESGLTKAMERSYDLMILDVKLPVISGNDICTTVRDSGIQTPIILLSALGSPADIARGIDSGATAYVLKPFDFDMLVDQVRSLTGGCQERSSDTLAVADLELDFTHQTVTRAGERMKLTAHEFMLLKYFVMNDGELLTRDMICVHVLNTRFDPRSNVADILVRMLQQKIDAGRERRFIEVIGEAGYRFNAPREAA